MESKNSKPETRNSNPEASASGVVQLTCNAAGHQVGETFKTEAARKLGILDHCKPFAPAPAPGSGSPK